MLISEEAPRPAHAGLHLVADQQRPSFPEQLARSGQVSGRRDSHALALNRLDDEGGYVALAQLSLERVQVTEGNGGVRHERVEAAAEFVGPVDRQRAGREPVEGVVAVEDAGPACRVPGELQCRLDGFRSAVAEVDPV